DRLLLLLLRRLLRRRLVLPRAALRRLAVDRHRDGLRLLLRLGRRLTHRNGGHLRRGLATVRDAVRLGIRLGEPAVLVQLAPPLAPAQHRALPLFGALREVVVAEV